MATLTDKQPGGVRVIVRERPFLDSDSNLNPRSCVSSEYLSTNEVSLLLKDLHTSRKDCYKVDSFYGQQDENVSQIFKQEISPLLELIFQGSNATVFAYGATGSGKTYTMQGTDEMPGLMTLSMSRVLSMCEIYGCFAHISYYQVYMDRCYDLLEPKTKEISVWDDKDGQVQLRGLSTVPIRSMVEFHEVLSSGIQRRIVAHTGLNDVSSRSHGVLVIVVTKTCTSGDDSTSVTTGKMNLIDLAGNEDNRRSCNEGIRIQESGKINQSLFALSNVIYALNNNKPRVPYRESKLTRILQDSLGGTSRSLMVACLNPGEYQESVYTVSLAARSRQICNYASSVQNPETPKVKIDMQEKLLTWLESKGKTKSTKRIAGLASPCASKTPIPMSSLKKQNLFQNSGKASCATYGRSVSKAKERRMLNFEATAVSSVNDDCLELQCGSNISPQNPGEYQESLYTVSLAARSHQICNYASSVQNPETPKVKIDMEEKLLAWLESKGKTKSTNRIVGLASPCASKTPIPMSSLKKQNLFQNFGKASCATYGRSASKAKERRMLKFEATAVSLVNADGLKISESESQMGLETFDLKGVDYHMDLVENVNNAEEHLESFNKTGINESEEDGKKTVTCNGCTNSMEPEACIIGNIISTGFEASEDSNGNAVVVSLANGDASKIAERGSHMDLVENLNNAEEHLESFNKTGINESEEDGKKTVTCNGCTNSMEPEACIIGKSLEEKMRTISVNTSESQLNSERVKTVSGSARIALSPINSNVNMKHLEDLPPKVPSCLFVVEPSTPRTLSVLSHNIDETTAPHTPLDRFCALTSNVKTTLVEEYVAFLNAASKEQLLGLKGIGPRRAECIIELREESPIKSLSDLENIGLSSKQVNDIFRRTARGIFD